MHDSPKQRLLIFIKSSGLGQTAFEEKVKMSRGSISNMKDSSGITSKVIEKIKKEYPSLNTAWLLTGEGDMLNEEPIVIEQDLSEIIGDLYERIISLEAHVEVFGHKLGTTTLQYAILKDEIKEIANRRLAEWRKKSEKVKK